MFVAVCKMSCPFERVHGGGNFLIFGLISKVCCFFVEQDQQAEINGNFSLLPNSLLPKGEKIGPGDRAAGRRGPIFSSTRAFVPKLVNHITLIMTLKENVIFMKIYFSFEIRFRSQFSSFLDQNQIFQPKFEFVLYYITKILNLFYIISLDFLSFLDLEYIKFSIHSLTHPFVRPSISYSLIIHFIKIT